MAPATEKTALADGPSSKRPCHGDAEAATVGSYSKLDAEIRRGKRRAILPVIIIAAAVRGCEILVDFGRECVALESDA